MVIVFDVNETLSDMSALDARFREVGAPAQLRGTWFAAVLRDGIALAACGSAAPFADIAAQVLRDTLADVRLDRPSADAVQHVLAGFPLLDLHPDVAPGLRRMSAAGLRLATLTNGGRDNSERMFTRTGVRDLFEQVLSVEQVDSWKPAARVYEHAARQCGVPIADTVMVAVHPWDLHGAKSAGMRTAWVNRSGADFPGYFAPPDYVALDMVDLADRLSAASPTPHPPPG